MGVGGGVGIGDGKKLYRGDWRQQLGVNYNAIFCI